MNVIPRGPTNARVMIVGEAPGAEEVKLGRPFVGSSGKELDRMLTEANIAPDSVRITNVTMHRPTGNNIELFMPPSKPKAAKVGATLFNGKYATKEILQGRENLREEIRRVRPHTVIGVGNVPLWACTGEWGVTKWRGSMMRGAIDDVEFDFMPTYHPAAILRMWKWRWIAVHDLKRIGRKREEWVRPEYDFLVRPSFNDAIQALNKLLRKLDDEVTAIACDIETRIRQIACIGYADSARQAICIPIMSATEASGSYWTDPAQEYAIIQLCRRILMHPNARIVGQNFLYDQQYLSKLWGVPYCMADDTMIRHHVCLPGTQKGLDFLSSLHCSHHEYWKDESKDWDPKLGEEQLWIYNCKDAVTTWEIYHEQEAMIDHFMKREQLAFQLDVARESFRMMLQGVKVNTGIKDHDNKELGRQMAKIRTFLDEVLYPFSIFGPKGISSLRVKQLAYDIFELPKKYAVVGKTKRLTAGKDAIKEWIKEVSPEFRPVLQAISDFRSLGVYRSTFAGARLDADNRFRCSISVAGPVTFRFATGSDAFGFGTNMQNIPANQRD